MLCSLLLIALGTWAIIMGISGLVNCCKKGGKGEGD